MSLTKSEKLNWNLFFKKLKREEKAKLRMNRSTSIFSERSDSTNIYQSSVDLSPNGIDLNRQVSVQNESKKNEPKYTKSAGKKYAKNDKNDKKKQIYNASRCSSEVH